MEAPTEYEYVVGGIYKYDKDTSDKDIIDDIIKDFTLKCDNIIKDFSNPESSLCSTTTYDLFHNRYEIENPGDVTVNGEEIYSDIPADECYELTKSKLSKKVFRNIFGAGEFPILTIWKGHHEGLDETHVTYAISR